MTPNDETARLDRLNLGCGPSAPSDWVNVDGSWNAWFSHHRRLRRALELVGVINANNQGARWNVSPLVHDLKRRLPFPDNTFSAIYASHVLEHLYRNQAQELLGECKRVLKPGGIVRLVVPDLHSMVENYVKCKRDGDTFAADNLNERLAFRSPTPPAGNILTRSYAVWKDFHSHKWMYDSDSLTHYLALAGFQKVSRKEFLSSDISGIEEVEQPNRVLDGAGICIEGKKIDD
jgi:predicted SAM-dependent methyltransferase